jgi:molecular chaperone HtpG
MAKHQFQTEIKHLLDLMINSLYSNKEIFLRELVSNSSDAIDKLKYLTLTDEKLKSLKFQPKIEIKFDDKKNILTISDNGIGMDKDDLQNNLGTIAKSGTKSFLANLSGDNVKDSNLIGQFGVGFYSVFMVASKVEVISKKAGDEKAYKWISSGDGNYDLDEAKKDIHGTNITLHLKKDEESFASKWQIESIIKKYSNHIPFPIYLEYTETEFEEQSKEDEEAKKEKISKEVTKNEKINDAMAIWTKSKKDLKKADYIDFYKSIGYDQDEPYCHVHTKAEGTNEYNTLFYIPKKAPFDLYRADYRSNVKLYVKRVFITDDDKELLPTYLRFIVGVIDSQDLPLNVSREILQQNKILATIKQASTKKILGEIKKLSKDKEKYQTFIDEFGKLLKEGLYQDHMNKDALMELVRFKSTNDTNILTSLEEYTNNMQKDQKAIYYITGGKEEILRNSPLLESFKDKNIDVLILDDELDEVIMPSIGTYKEKEFKSVNRTDTANDLETKEDKEKAKKAEPIIKKIKNSLGDKVKDVKVSARLKNSPSCVVADENDPTASMQQMLKAMGQNMPDQEIKPILEINLNHKIVKKLDSLNDNDLKDISNLLLDQALLSEGVVPKDIKSFNENLNKAIEKSLYETS